jgi:cyclopropane-fatty-acyl-phospholipid synthase
LILNLWRQKMSSKNAEKIAKELLSEAGITVNGNKPYDIQIHNPKFYSRVLRKQVLGLGESYMDGWWDCDAIDVLITKIIQAGLEAKVKGNWKYTWHILRSKMFNLQNLNRVYQVAHQHYDIGNELYQAMLDKRLNYACAYWKTANNLDEAQEAKLDLICRKLELVPGMTVLDLGCGFGSFAGFAAEKYGVSVTGINVSKAQLELAKKRYKDLPVTFILDDYRSASGTYDRVISIGFMEHVGYKNYSAYMEVVDRCLAKDGIAFIHSIGSNISKTASNPWTTKYIFPNGMLPSIAQLSQAMEKYYVIEDLHNIGPEYDLTLMAWYRNFTKAWPDLKSKYDERFYRMWLFYLLSSAGGFRVRGTQLWQFVMTRPGRTQPNCRLN